MGILMQYAETEIQNEKERIFFSGQIIALIYLLTLL